MRKSHSDDSQLSFDPGSEYAKRGIFVPLFFRFMVRYGQGLFCGLFYRIKNLVTKGTGSDILLDDQ